MNTHFRDPAGGFFDTRDDQEKLLLRPKDLQDNATPSGNALAALALLQLAAYSGNGEWREQAETMLGGIGEMLERYPTGFSQWLYAADFALAPVQEVAILGSGESAGVTALVETLWAAYRPHLVAAISTYPPENNAPELLINRALISEQASAYVCRNFASQIPVTKPEDLKTQLEAELE